MLLEIRQHFLFLDLWLEFMYNISIKKRKKRGKIYMDLVNFLGWEDRSGIYRSRVNGELYRIVNNRLETFVPEISDWRESNIRVNKLYKLMPMKQVGTWSEGFEIHSEEEWEFVKNYYLQRNSNLDTVCLFEREYVAKWHSTDVLDTLKD